tara:strand:+ start:202 stop:483 length:282 start_codon:yes stop_codon:yes gene_type:complete
MYSYPINLPPEMYGTFDNTVPPIPCPMTLIWVFDSVQGICFHLEKKLLNKLMIGIGHKSIEKHIPFSCLPLLVKIKIALYNCQPKVKIVIPKY